MPSDETVDIAAKSVTASFAVIVVLYGIFIAQHVLLGLFTALLAVLIYIAWRILRTSERNRDNGLQS